MKKTKSVTKKMRITAAMLSAMLLFTSCGSQTGSGGTTETASTDAGSESSTEAAAEAVSDAASYAKENGIEFTSFSPMSLDYNAFFFEKDTAELVDNDEFRILDQGKMDYNFYSLMTYPAEKEGYTTAKFVYTASADQRIYNKTYSEDENLDEVLFNIMTRDVGLFDYYTGTIIPSYESMPNHQDTYTGKTDPVSTEIEYEGKKWDLTSWLELSDTSYSNNYTLKDNAHGERDMHYLRLNALYVTYPDGYDGLSFAFDRDGVRTIDEDLENVKKSTEAGEKRNENIGKKILDIVEDGSIKDYIFCTVKDENSVTVEKYASEEDAEYLSFAEVAGLNSYNSALDAASFYLPIQFVFYDTNGNILTGDRVTVNDPECEFKLSDIKSEEGIDGNTKISMNIDLNKEFIFEVTDESIDSIDSVVWFPEGIVKVYDEKNGSEAEVTENIQYDSSYGEWTDYTHLPLNFDETHTVEFSVPTDRLEHTAVLFGDRLSDEHMQFKLSELLK